VLQPPLEQTTDSFLPASLEEWRTVVTFPLYEVSSLGRARNKETGRLMSVIMKGGRPCVQVMRAPGRQTTAGLATLVLETFGSPRPRSSVARSRDGDATNVRFENLYWGAWNEPGPEPKTKRLRVRVKALHFPEPTPSLPGEEWRPVAGFVALECSNLGRFKRHGIALRLKPKPKDDFPRFQSLADDGRTLSVKCAKVILEAFGTTKPNGHCHLGYRDGNPFNLRLENLLWAWGGAGVADHGPILDDYGIQDTARHLKPEFRGQRVGLGRLTSSDAHQIRKRLAAGVPVNVIAEEYGISTQNVRLFDERAWRKL
jgi:hypothetical protein